MIHKPKVSLINYTPMPLQTMCYARRVMHNPVPDSLHEFNKNPKKFLDMDCDKYFNDVLLKDGMPTFLEYVLFTFKLENVSRSLQQQLTRHRIGFSFSIQSLRCVNLPKFAKNGNYTNPYDIKDKRHKAYHSMMLGVEKIYNNALKKEIATQDARGLLPMNIHSTITFSCTFRALIDMVNKRLCLKTQEEFRSVAEQIINCIKNIDKRLVVYFKTPCDYGKCMMEGENFEQYKKGLLTGKQNTDHVCPKWVKKNGA